MERRALTLANRPSNARPPGYAGSETHPTNRPHAPAGCTKPGLSPPTANGGTSAARPSWTAPTMPPASSRSATRNEHTPPRCRAIAISKQVHEPPAAQTPAPSWRPSPSTERQDHRYDA